MSPALDAPIRDKRDAALDLALKALAAIARETPLVRQKEIADLAIADIIALRGGTR